jgi:hypothetical protein
MPAIDLSRLKTQAARLADNFSNQMGFIHEMHAMLELYTNHTMRASQVARRLSLPTYHTPAPVLRLIERELIPLADQYPLKATILAAELWKDGSLESRLLAARLTGMIPPEVAIPILTRLPDWLAMSPDKEIRSALLTDAFTRLRRENIDTFLLVLEDWLSSSQNSLVGWGLRALIPLLTDPNFENLPVVFRILKPAFRSAGPAIQLELKACLITLEQVSPTETLSFIRELIRDNPSPLLLRTFRRILGGLSPHLQSAVREMLQVSNP